MNTPMGNPTEDARPSPRGPLHALAWLCFGIGTILMLAMSFGILRQDLALFLGTSAFVVGGLLWGFADQRARPGAGPSDGQGPTVSRRAP